MNVWIDTEAVTELAVAYRTRATSIRAAADRLRADRFGSWGTDTEIAAFGTRFAGLAVCAAAELDRYATSTHALGDTMSAASTRLADADSNWRRQ